MTAPASSFAPAQRAGVGLLIGIAGCWPQVRALLAASEAAARTLRATVEAERLGGRA